MMNIWMSSDWHYGHRNIVYGESRWDNKEKCRKFKTVEEHNERLIKNINTYAKYGDVMYFLGDFVMGGADNIFKFWSRLECMNIIFIGGNHDHHIRKNTLIETDMGLTPAQSIFTEYHELLERRIGEDTFVMCHYPLKSWHKPDKALHIFGHCHGNLEAYNTRAMDVGIDTHPEFRPYHIDEVRKQLKNKN